MFKITNAGKRAEILLYGSIGAMFDRPAESFIREIRRLNVDTIDLRIYSDGGQVTEGFSIYEALKAHRAKINIHIDVLAASIASVIAMAGDTITITPTGFVMIHNPKGATFGEAGDMRKTADLLDMMEETIRDIYVKRTGQTAQVIDDLMAEETYMTAKDAMSLGFVDRIVEEKKIAASANNRIASYFNNTPEPLRAALGSKSGEESIAGVTASKPRSTPMNVMDQINSWDSKRTVALSRMQEIMAKADEEGRDLDEKESEEFDTVSATANGALTHINRLREIEKIQAGTAKPVGTATNMDEGNQSRVPHITMKPVAPPGIRFARYAMCVAHSRGNPFLAADIGKKFCKDDHDILKALNAAVEGANTGDADWLGDLNYPENFMGDFVEYLRPKTVLGQFGANGIPSLRRVPFNVRIMGETAGGNGYWVGEGKPVPVTKSAVAPVTLGFAKVANIAVLTKEMMRFSSPSAEALVRDTLAAALISRLDTDFINPNKAAASGVSPAGVLNGQAVYTQQSNGVTAEAAREDVRDIMSYFIAQNNTPTTGVWVMPQTTALTLSLMRNQLGQKEFEGITMNGGTWEGLPVITSQYVPAGVIALVNASDIYLSDDGVINLDASGEASLEMEDDGGSQDSTDGAGTDSLVSMWQTRSVALMAERWINWQRRRDNGVAYLTDAIYYTPETT